MYILNPEELISEAIEEYKKNPDVIYFPFKKLIIYNFL